MAQSTGVSHRSRVAQGYGGVGALRAVVASITGTCGQGEARGLTVHASQAGGALSLRLQVGQVVEGAWRERVHITFQLVVSSLRGGAAGIKVVYRGKYLNNKTPHYLWIRLLNVLCWKPIHLANYLYSVAKRNN